MTDERAARRARRGRRALTKAEFDGLVRYIHRVDRRKHFIEGDVDDCEEVVDRSSRGDYTNLGDGGYRKLPTRDE